MVKRVQVRSLMCVVVVSVAAHAPLRGQMHKVEKTERVTRAVGVYEWTGEMTKPEAARLVPVSLFIDSHFEDAGVYLARPVPFVLQTGDEYSVEHAGQGLGLLDVEYARNVVTRRAANDDDPVGAWYGYGRFAEPVAPKKSNLKDAAVKSQVNSQGASGEDDEQPHFVVRSGAEDTGDASAKTSGKGPGGGPDKGTEAKKAEPVNPAPADDPDRPTLRHRDAPPEGKLKKEKPSGEVIAMNTSLNDDPDRPRMRRGVPTAQVVPSALGGLPPNLHQAVAVSDPANREPHAFAREWESSDERAQTLKQMEALARTAIAAYLTTNKLKAMSIAGAGQDAAKGTTPAPASQAKSAPSARSTNGVRRPVAKKAVAAQSAFVLTNEELKGYLLSYGGLPTFVYTAEVPVAAGGPVYLTMAAQRLPTGELQVALSSVTDATHLNRVPWLRPVDVVDPDWSHRASLLVELRAQSSRQFALYRIVTAKAEQEFVTGTIE